VESQAQLPLEYLNLSEGELRRRAWAAKARLGESLCILGHHYQRDEVVQFADFVGDSLKLSQQAAAQKKAKYVVFCGVHFMAESADILASPGQAVILPNLSAGCAMADLADEHAVAAAMEELDIMGAGRVVPVAYVNSSAAVKAITARAGGACCTSSNVRNVFEWAFAPKAGGAGGEKVFAIPDQHIGRNTALAMGFSPDDCVVYDPAYPGGRLSRDDVKRARFFLWKGQCHIHQVFSPRHVEAARRKRPGIRVIVHPECPREVVAAADAFGSTEQIIRAVAEGGAGAAFAIGTESNLVERLARRHTDRLVLPLADFPAICRQMYCVDLPHLLWVLENLLAGRVVNRVRVEEALAAEAREALRRMVAIPAASGLTAAPAMRKKVTGS
jgi:quinolinate synthase